MELYGEQFFNAMYFSEVSHISKANCIQLHFMTIF